MGTPPHGPPRRSGGIAHPCAAWSAAPAGYSGPRAGPASPPCPALDLAALALSTRRAQEGVAPDVVRQGQGEEDRLHQVRPNRTLHFALVPRMHTSRSHRHAPVSTPPFHSSTCPPRAPDAQGCVYRDADHDSSTLPPASTCHTRIHILFTPERAGPSLASTSPLGCGSTREASLRRRRSGRRARRRRRRGAAELGRGGAAELLRC